MSGESRAHALHRVAQIELLGRSYDLAQNDHYHLVASRGPDVYGTPTYELAELPGTVGDCRDLIGALVDALGDALDKLKAEQVRAQDLERAMQRAAGER